MVKFEIFTNTTEIQEKEKRWGRETIAN